MIVEYTMRPGWIERPTNELFFTQTGSTPPKKEMLYYGDDIPLVKPPELVGGAIKEAEDNLSELGASRTRLLPVSSTLVSCIGNLGKVGINAIPVAFNQQINAILPERLLAIPEFIFYQTQSAKYKEQLEELSSATTVTIVNKKKFDSICLRIAPLNEQRRIVEKIETLFAQLDKGEAALREVQKLLARYRQSVLKAAVTGQLTADWRAENAHRLEHGRDLLARILQTRRETWEGRGKYKEPAAPDTSHLPELPEGWVWATLPMLGEFGRGKSKHRPRNDPRLYSDGRYPFLQTGRVRRSGGRISGYDALYNDAGLAQSKLWPKGTICITIAANIAESGILEIEACFPDSVVGLVTVPGIDAEYVEYFIRTARENLDRYAPATAQKNINLEILRDLAIPIPPEEEQLEIKNLVDQALSTAEALESACESELARSIALRQSILKDAFAGRLAPQDPTDEPAADLLVRIKKARAAAPRKTRKKVTA